MMVRLMDRSGKSALHYLAPCVPQPSQRSAYRRLIADLAVGGASVAPSSVGRMTPLHYAGAWAAACARVRMCVCVCVQSKAK